jgi:hypothetical protein
VFFARVLGVSQAFNVVNFYAFLGLIIKSFWSFEQKDLPALHDVQKLRLRAFDLKNFASFKLLITNIKEELQLTNS